LSLGDHLLWGVASPFVVWICMKRPIARADLLISTLCQLAIWLGFPALLVLPVYGCRLGVARLLHEPELAMTLSFEAALRVWVWAVLACLDVIVAAHALYYALQLRERDRRAAQLETRLAQARLDVLRMQIHPHFLFNTLNSIATLMHRDVAAAERMLVLLGDLLRESLARGDAQTVSLERELSFVDRYIEIERTRFGDRLSVERSIEAATLRAEVPNLLLQPLVENALRHGLGRKPGAGRLTMSSARDGSALELRVRDDGVGPGAVSQCGLGLVNTRSRLEQMYGDAHSFVAAEAVGGGFEVVIRLPFRLADQPEA
jgi:hypothetical protein